MSIELQPVKDPVERPNTPGAGAKATLANERQIGGSHYAGAYQHWDFVRKQSLDYWQGCASKYLTHWRKKNGIQDLEKAAHFIEKRKENPECPASIRYAWDQDSLWAADFMRFVVENELQAVEIAALYHIVRGEWDNAIERIEELIGETLEKADI